jgi:hypothetical protein
MVCLNAEEQKIVNDRFSPSTYQNNNLLLLELHLLLNMLENHDSLFNMLVFNNCHHCFDMLSEYVFDSE